MHIERYLRLVAGVFVIATVALAHWVSPWFLIFTAFVGANLLQSAFTRSCPMMAILRKAGLPDDASRKARAGQPAGT